MDVLWPGDGPAYCQFLMAAGVPCAKHEIDGLGFCFMHVPEEYLDEAEMVTGKRRCRKQGTGGPCRVMAIEGSDPPVCIEHGGRSPLQRKRAAANIVSARVGDRLAEIMAENGERLLAPRDVVNPLAELLALAGELAEWKDIMRQVVAYLYSKERLRSAHAKVGEQLRAEILLYERAIERFAKILLDIHRAGIEQQLARIQDRQVTVMERALDATLSIIGLDLAAQEKARTVLRGEIVKAEKLAS